MEIVVGLAIYFTVGLVLTVLAIRLRLVKKQNTGVILLLWPFCIALGLITVIAFSLIFVAGLSLSWATSRIGNSRFGNLLWRLGNGTDPEE